MTVVIAGRPNAGKSSLLNALFGRKVAITSRRAGRTRSLNLFRAGERFRLVDVPGYGHGSTVQHMEAVGEYIALHVRREDGGDANGSDSQQRGASMQTGAAATTADRAHTRHRGGGPQDTSEAHAHAAHTLSCTAILLVDARRGLMEPDRFTLSLLAEAQAPLRVVLTKADQLGLPLLRNMVRSTTFCNLKKAPKRLASQRTFHSLHRFWIQRMRWLTCLAASQAKLRPSWLSGGWVVGGWLLLAAALPTVEPFLCFRLSVPLPPTSLSRNPRSALSGNGLDALRAAILTDMDLLRL
jgi:GTP-binding protein EngB required for normal cell division